MRLKILNLRQSRVLSIIESLSLNLSYLLLNFKNICSSLNLTIIHVWPITDLFMSRLSSLNRRLPMGLQIWILSMLRCRMR